ncbi:MAG: cell division protein FtsZ [Burkholderiaceae bacterium]|nr:cell division protein FtsZ [Burkholderiaceae bacterium]
MNSLQLWLAALGALVLAAVIAHGAWTTRRAGGGRRLPSLDAAPSRHLEPRFDDAALGEGAPAAPGEAPTVMAPKPPRRTHGTPRIDALIDAIAVLAVDQPVSGETLLAHLPPSRRAGGKPFLVEGRHRDSGEWEPPAPDTWYREVQAGVQLANRLGPLNEIEYSEFVQKIQAFADAIGATPDFPDMLDVVARARELDAFASGHDAQLAMRLRPRRNAWALPFVQQHASRHGFVPGATPGRLVLPGSEEGAPPMLALQFDPQAALADDPRQARIDEVTLVFDVPHTAAAEQPFNAWCAAGRALALGLDALVSDDKGQPLHPDAFPMVGSELGELYAKLAERDLPAGSPAARRLFS